MNYYRLLFGLVPVLTTWKLFDRPQSNETQEDGRTNSLSLKQLENLFTTTLMEEKRQEKQTQPQLEKVLNDDLSVKPALTFFSGSLPLDSVLFLLLIQTCGADLVSSISSVLHFVFSWLDLVVTVTLTIYTWKRRPDLVSSVSSVLHLVVFVTLTIYTWKRRLSASSPDQDAAGSQTQTHIPMTVGAAVGGLVVGVICLCRKCKANSGSDNSVKRKRLTDVKNELLNQRNQLRDQLEEVETQREKNKQKLQQVEKEITEKETMFEDAGDLLREKEKLLHEQWRLDQTKRDKEKQLLNAEKLLEPIENHFTDNDEHGQTQIINL